MKNYLQEGTRRTYTNSTGSTITSGTPVLVGNRLGIAVGDILDTETGVLAMVGVFSIAKLSTDVVTQGDNLYWDNGNSRLTLTALANTLIGYAQAAAGNGVTTVECRINQMDAPVMQAANADTSGLDVTDLETEVNEIKAVLRTTRIIAT